MTEQEPISRKPLLYSIKGTERVEVRKDVSWRGAAGIDLLMDIYSPPEKSGSKLPAVVIVAGFRDAGFVATVGCHFREMASVMSWSRLIAANGVRAVAYANEDPSADLVAMLAELRSRSDELGIDADRIALWASSGNGPLALSTLMSDAALACGVLYYPFTLDLGAETHVADAAKRWKFSTPAMSIDSLRRSLPIFVARAGEDEVVHLNDALDGFISESLKRNVPLTVVNHASAPHAFDLFHDSVTTRSVIASTIQFLRLHLLGEGPA